jgi:hypothetical protein
MKRADPSRRPRQGGPGRAIWWLMHPIHCPNSWNKLTTCWWGLGCEIDDHDLKNRNDFPVMEPRLWVLRVKRERHPYNLLIRNKVRLQITNYDKEFLQSSLGLSLWSQREGTGRAKNLLCSATQPEMSRHSFPHRLKTK